MTQKEKTKIKEILDRRVKSYFQFKSRDDYPEKLCIRRAVLTSRETVFILAEFLYHCGFITFEECCEYWTKVDITDDEEEPECIFTKCGANVDGVCKYKDNNDYVLGGAE